MLIPYKVIDLNSEPNPFKYEKVFCENLKLFREKNNMTTWEISEVSGLAYKDVERMENGLMPIDLDLNCIFHLARCFGISPTEFFEDRNE